MKGGNDGGSSHRGNVSRRMAISVRNGVSAISAAAHGMAAAAAAKKHGWQKEGSIGGGMAAIAVISMKNINNGMAAKEGNISEMAYRSGEWR